MTREIHLEVALSRAFFGIRTLPDAETLATVASRGRVTNVP